MNYKLIKSAGGYDVYFKEGHYAEDEFPGGYLGHVYFDRSECKWFVKGLESIVGGLDSKEIACARLDVEVSQDL